MKIIFTLVIFLHGILHIIGALKVLNISWAAPLLNPSFQLSESSLRIAGIIWLVVCMQFIVTAISFMMNKDWWWLPAMLAVMLSQLMIIIYWNDARWGSVINLLILLVSVVSWAEWNFSRHVDAEARLLFRNADKEKLIITNESLKDLPACVQTWLTMSGVVGKERMYAVRLQQTGSMKTAPQEKWIHSDAEQYITTVEPGFIWKTKMMMTPLLPVTGRDRSVNGKAEMNIRLFSLIPVQDQSNDQMNQGALQRWLAEMCWYPSAALNEYITWEELSELSARATINYKGVTASMDFHFNQQGDIMRCTASRYMSVGRKNTLEKWEVRSTAFASMEGIRIPVRSEVTWKLKNGDFTWYKIELTRLEYNLAKVF